MNKVRVEVFYQDNALQSIRIDHYEMEGLVAIENKTIPEWFMPASGRASWKLSLIHISEPTRRS